MEVNAAAGGLSVTFYPPNESALQTIKLQTLNHKIPKRKHKFKTV